jgi:murein DD-endopeptidase MepM/ murein hydrolase activator NlpD
MFRARASRALAAVASAASVSCLASGVLPVTVELRARAFGPGEPVRVEVVSAEPLETLQGEFLGRGIFFVREGGNDGAGERWTGWSMIGLEQEPGVAAIEIRGRATSGRSVAGTRAISIQDLPFPTETLTVAPKYVEPPPEAQERIARERRKLKALYLSRRNVAPSGRVFVRPVAGEPTSVFGTKRLYNGKPRSPHPGLDLRASSGTPVESSGEGRVGLSRDLYYSGNTVIVDHGGGLFTLYAHLSKLLVSEGDEIEAGQVVGLSGATGRVTGPHLHWGAKIGDRPFDPTALLDARLFGEANRNQ